MSAETSRRSVALSVWDGRISPVFDSAQRLLIVEIVDGKHVSDREQPLADERPFSRATRLRELGVDTLICGAVSRSLAVRIAAAGIALRSFVTGDVGEVVKAYLDGRLDGPEFRMPGCCGGRRRRRRGEPSRPW